MNTQDDLHHLAGRVRAALAGMAVTEKRMFGGITGHSWPSRFPRIVLQEYNPLSLTLGLIDTWLPSRGRF